MLKPNGEVNRKDIINKVKEKWGYKFSRFMYANLFLQY